MAPCTAPDYTLRLATPDDIPALATLIPLSVRALQAAHYSAEQMEAALGPVFGVDRQLIADGTYYAVIDDAGTIVGCGGWSRRNALFGSDADRPADDGLLDPQRDAARIRAFFVHPAWVRRGMGRALLDACEAALQSAGFRKAELVATLPGVPLYTVAGFVPVRAYEVPLVGGLGLPVVGMRKLYAVPGF